MTRKELENKIMELVAMSYGKDTSAVSLSTSFKEDLSGASVQMVSLVAEIENELDAVIALQDAAGCATVADLVTVVEAEL